MKLSPRLYADLVGTPYGEGGRGPETFDCLGLQMELQARLGRKVPSYISDATELHRQIATGGFFASAPRLDAPEAGCLVLMRGDGALCHLGGMLDEYRLFHTNRQTGSAVIEVLARSPWGRRVMGFYATEVLA